MGETPSHREQRYLMNIMVRAAAFKSRIFMSKQNEDGDKDDQKVPKGFEKFFKKKEEGKQQADKKEEEKKEEPISEEEDGDAGRKSKESTDKAKAEEQSDNALKNYFF